MGVSIRHFHNSQNARKGNPWWTWGITAALFAMIVWLSVPGAPEDIDAARTKLTPAEARFAAAPGFDAARDVVLGNCSMCHAREPLWDGLAWAPKGVLLETDADIAAQARAIYLQAGISHAMPPANVTWMDDEARVTLQRWYRAALD
jgi:uncharacterized membrane protein